MALHTILTDVIPARTARAYTLKAGDTIRVIEHEGLQVADCNIYALPDMKEHFSSSATRRILMKNYIRIGDELWSNPLRDRVMMRFVDDTTDYPADFPIRPHSLLPPGCTPFMYKWRKGLEGHAGCRQSLADAIAPFGIGPDDTHDTLSVWNCIGTLPDGTNTRVPAPARKGDFVEFEALMDCVFNASACPADEEGGDVITNGGIPKALGIEVRRGHA